MSDRINGKIYKVICDVDNSIYVGSTIFTLSIRMSQHRCKSRYASSKLYEHMRTHGTDKFKIELIEEAEFDGLDKLKQRERYYYDLLHPSLNVYRPWVTKEERIEISKRNMKKIYSTTKPVCKCGITYTYTNKTNHENTNKHKNLMLMKTECM